MSRIRANQITNQAADGAPTVQHGLIIAGVSTFTGSVSIGGTLTYEDVTNIDSVGLITARNGINVSSGNINASSGRILIGTTTEGHAEGDDLTIATSGVTGMTIRSGTGSAGNIFFSDATSGSAERQGIIRYDHADDAMKFNVNNAERLRVDGSGRLLIGTSTNNAHANADNAVISGTGNIGLSIMSTDSGRSSIYFGDSSSSPGSYAGFIDFIHSSNSFNVGRGNDNSLTIDSSGRVLIGTTTVGETSADDLTLSTSGHTGITIRSGSSNYGNLFFTDLTSGDQFQGYVQYNHSDNSLRLGTQKLERLRIASNGFVGINEDDPQTELNVRGTISTGRNVARELGTIINISANYNASRNGVNVINGKKNYEDGNNDWLVNSPVNANLTIDLGVSVNCDRFVIYNQNEYANSKREVKRFTLEGSNDNSSWTTVLDDECGASNGHEPNPGWSFRIPSNITDDDEGYSYRYWKFTMKTFPSSNDSYGGVMELELYEAASNDTDGEITTSSLSAGTVNASIVQTVAQPSFHARLINHKNADQDPLIFDDVLVNVGNHYYSTGSDAGKFVVPVRGTYFFFWEAIKNGSSGVARLYLMKNNARIYNSMHLRLQEEGNYANGCMNVIMQLDPEDRIHIDLEDGGVHASEYTHFGGYLIG